VAHLDAVLREDLAHVLLLLERVEHLVEVEQTLEVDGHAPEAVAFDHTVLEAGLEFVLAEGAAADALQLLVAQGLGQHDFDVLVEVGFLVHLLAEGLDLLADAFLEVDGHLEPVLAGHFDAGQVEVEFLSELLVGVGELGPLGRVLEVEVHVEDVVLLLVECVHHVGVEEAVQFAHLLLDAGVLDVHAFALAGVPEDDFV